jgi:hypothetical protein
MRQNRTHCPSPGRPERGTAPRAKGQRRNKSKCCRCEVLILAAADQYTAVASHVNFCREWSAIRTQAHAPLGTPQPRASGGLRMQQLRGGEQALRQAWIAEVHLDHDDAVRSHPRADGRRQIAEDELEMRDLQAFRGYGDFAIGSEANSAEMMAKRLPGLSSGDDEDRSLNPEHVDLFKKRVCVSRTAQCGSGLIQAGRRNPDSDVHSPRGKYLCCRRVSRGQLHRRGLSALLRQNRT